MNKIREVDQYIEKSVAGQGEILEQLRGLISEAVPEVEEKFKWGQPVYGTTKDFVYLV